MSTSYSTNLALALPATGELSGTWGTTVNTNITNMLDEALGYQAYSATGGADTITIPDGTTGVARSIYIQLNGTGGGSVAVPATKTKMYFVFNNTASAITFKVTGQTGVSIPAAAKMALVSNGTDVIVAQNYFSALTLGAALPVASGGTGLTAGTSGGVLAYTATGTLASSTALAANALVIGGGAGAAPSTTTTGTGVVTALGVNVGTAGAFVVNGGALGTPSSGTVTNLTGTANITVTGGASGAIAATTLTTSSTVTLNGGTANGVAYLDGSKVLTTGTALTFDGTYFTVGASSTTGDYKAFIQKAGGELLGLNASSGTLARIAFGNATASFGSTQIIANAADLAFITNSAEQMRLSSTGLAVTGTLSATGNATLSGATAEIQFTGATYGWLRSTVGDLYIDAPSAKSIFLRNAGTTIGTVSSTGLAVTGTLSSTLDATIYGLTVGRGAGAVSTNTVVGSGALATNSTGTGLTAVGYQALNVSTADYNTAVGWSAGFRNSSGTKNTFLGVASGYNVTTGQSNTFVGYTSGPNAALSTGSYNTAVGESSLFSNTTADYNTAVGYQAGYSNTTGRNTTVGAFAAKNNTTGDRNTALGDQSLFNNTTGSYNVAVGQDALLANTTASSNTAVGYQAGYTTSTGARSTAIGHSALYSATVSDNTAIGYFSGYLISTGQYNLAVGGGDGASGATLSNNTTGSNNTALGFQSLRSNTTASNNTAVGYQASYSNTTGAASTVVGFQAAYANTTGDSNAVFGFYALGNNSTGSNNVAVGRQALVSNTTASSNTAVGYQALYSNTTAGSNTAVGYQAFYSTTTGNIGTAVGQRAGYGVTGLGNVCIGYGAGDGAGSTLTSGTYNVLVGTGASTANPSDVNSVVLGTSGSTSGATGKGSNTGFIDPNGGGVYQGNNSSSWSTTSDQRLKKNIADNNDGLNKINSIRVRNFEYRIEEEITELSTHCAIAKTGVQLGVIAQELQAVLPECVKQESTGVLSVDTDNLTWYLVNAVKELTARIKQLEGN